MKIQNIGYRPIKQEPWHRQIQNMMSRSIRLIDTMSINEIIIMYKNKNFLCDICGKKLQKDEYDLTLEYHITHMINPKILWMCELCLNDDIDNGRILASIPVKN